MPSPAERADTAPSRRFLLAAPPDPGPARLVEPDEHHARRVLRLGPGDPLVGLDGAGAAWPLRVGAQAGSLGRRDPLPLEPDGPPRREPAPGEPGAPLPRIELALPLPKGRRAEDCVDRLTQLGLARVRPLVTARSAPHARAAGPARLERLARAAGEACKQSGRLWLPELAPPATLEELLAEVARRAPRPRLLHLDPRAAERLDELLPPRAQAFSAPLLLVLGPEGGLAPEEQERLRAAGSRAARLAPHVLRIETAAEAATAIAVHALEAPAARGQ